MAPVKVYFYGTKEKKYEVAFLQTWGKSQVTWQFVSQEGSRNNQYICCWQVQKAAHPQLGLQFLKWLCCQRWSITSVHPVF